MAEGEYRRLCTVAACGKNRKVKGLCLAHYQRVRAGLPAERVAITQRCAHCGEAFSALRRRMYCSTRCNYAAQNRKKHRPRAAYYASVRDDSAHFRCEFCGKECHRSLSGTNRRKGSRNRWCSMDCKRQQMALASQTRQEERRQAIALAAERRKLLSALRGIEP